MRFPRYSLKKLLKGMNQKNMHKEIDWGPDRGKEKIY